MALPVGEYGQPLVTGIRQISPPGALRSRVRRRLGPDEGVHARSNHDIPPSDRLPTNSAGNLLRQMQHVRNVGLGPRPAPDFFERSTVHAFDETLVTDSCRLTSIGSADELPKQLGATIDARLKSHVPFVDQKCARNGSSRCGRLCSTGRCRVPDDPFDRHGIDGACRLATSVCARRATERADGWECRHHGLKIVVVGCHRTGRKTIGGYEAPRESLDHLRRCPAMPR